MKDSASITLGHPKATEKLLTKQPLSFLNVKQQGHITFNTSLPKCERESLLNRTVHVAATNGTEECDLFAN